MARAAINWAVDLVQQDCGTCGIVFAVPEHMDAIRRRDGGSWCCPNGHEWSYTEPEVKRLKRELLQARTQAAEAEARASEAARQVHRTERGTCPHCKRHFANVERHMKSKHPDRVA